METGKPCKNTIYGFSCSYLKNKLGDVNFLLYNLRDKHARIKLLAKFEKILQSRFRATLNFLLVKVALKLKKASF